VPREVVIDEMRTGLFEFNLLMSGNFAEAIHAVLV